MRVLALTAILGAVALATPAMAQGYGAPINGPALSYQAYAHQLTRSRAWGEYNEALGTSDHGVPAAAQAQARVAPGRDVYDQWDYTGWGGLTKHAGQRAAPNSQWSARAPYYTQANPPRG